MTFFTVAFLFAVSGATDPELGHSGRSLRGPHRGSEKDSRMMQDDKEQMLETRNPATVESLFQDALGQVNEQFFPNEETSLEQDEFDSAMGRFAYYAASASAPDRIITEGFFGEILDKVIPERTDLTSEEEINKAFLNLTAKAMESRDEFNKALETMLATSEFNAAGFKKADSNDDKSVSRNEFETFIQDLVSGVDANLGDGDATKAGKKEGVDANLGDGDATKAGKKEGSGVELDVEEGLDQFFAHYADQDQKELQSVVTSILQPQEAQRVLLTEQQTKYLITEKKFPDDVSDNDRQQILALFKQYVSDVQEQEGAGDDGGPDGAETASLTNSDTEAMKDEIIRQINLLNDDDFVRLGIQFSEDPELAEIGQTGEEVVKALTRPNFIQDLQSGEFSAEVLEKLLDYVNQYAPKPEFDGTSQGEGEQSVKEDEDGGIAGQAKDVVTGQVEEAPAVTGAAAAAAAAVAAQQGENEPADIDVEPVDLDETEVIEQSEPYRDFAKDKVSSAANTAVDVVTGLVGDETETIDGPLATPEDVLNEASNKSTLPLYPVLGSQQYRAGTPAALDNGFSHDLELLRAMPMTFNEHMEHSTEDIIKNFLKNSGLDQEIVNNLIFGLHGTGLVKHIVANVVSGLVHANAAKQAVDRQDAANNYARGHYTIGKEIVDLVLDKVKFWSKTHATAAEAAAQQLLEATPTTYGKQDPLPIEMMSK